MRTRERPQDLADLSVKCYPELDQRIRQLVQLENCRSYPEIVVYFLEVMLAVYGSNPDLPLTVLAAEGEARLTGQIRAEVPAQLRSDLTQFAAEFGMIVPELVRILLEMALNLHGLLVPANEIIRKEVFQRRIEAELKLQRCPSFVRRLLIGFIRRIKR